MEKVKLKETTIYWNISVLNSHVAIFAVLDPIPQFLRSSDTSSTQASESPKPASVEVDILTNCSIDSSEGEVNKDSPEPRRSQASTEKAASEITDSLVLQDTSLCEQTEEDSLPLNKAETVKNYDALAVNLQPEDDDLQRRKMMEDIQNTFQKDLSNEKEKLYRKDQGVSDADQLQGHEKDGRAAENFQCQSKIQTDLINLAVDLIPQSSSWRWRPGFPTLCYET